MGFYKNLPLEIGIYKLYTGCIHLRESLGGQSMNTAVINIKTDENLKKQAQKVAAGLGLSLSSLINAYLKEMVKTKRVEFSLNEKPRPYLIKVLKQAKANRKAGKGSPIFKTGEEAVKWLEEQGI